MLKKLVWIIVILCYSSLIVFAHGEADDGIMTTITLKNVLIIAIAFGLSIVYSGIVWSKLAKRSSWLFLGIAFLLAYAGFIHLAAGRGGDWILLANGLGYLVFVFLRGYELIRTTKWNNVLSVIIIIYTIITFMGYFLTHDHYDVIAISSKIIEVLLIISLVVELFQTYRAQSNYSLSSES